MRVIAPLIVLAVLGPAVAMAAAPPPYPPTGDRVRPLVGGYQVKMWKEIRFWPDEGAGPCTLGFPVYRVVDRAYGVVTAGHCNRWEKDGWNYEWVMHQPVRDGDNNKIGPVEATACVVDATLVLYDNVYPGVLHIYSGGSYETLEVTDWITWSEVSNYLGETFYKTGRTTGTTNGTLVGWEYKKKLPECYIYKIMYFTYDSAGGDSGSPVYRKLGGHAVLIGYHIGRSGDIRIALNVENLWDAFGVKPYVCWWC